MTIAVQSFHGRSLPSLQVLLAAFVVTFGFFVGVTPDATSTVTQHLLDAPSRTAIIYGILSSLFIAVHAVLIKSSLQYAGNSTIQLAYWQNLGSAIFLAPFILFQGEFSTLSELLSSPEWNPRVFMWGSIVTGVFGFLLCVAGLLSIKVTSPVTHMFSSVSIAAYCLSTHAVAHFALHITRNPPHCCRVVACGMTQAARSAVQTLLGVWIFNDILTT